MGNFGDQLLKRQEERKAKKRKRKPKPEKKPNFKKIEPHSITGEPVLNALRKRNHVLLRWFSLGIVCSICFFHQSILGSLSCLITLFDLSELVTVVISRTPSSQTCIEDHVLNGVWSSSMGSNSPTTLRQEDQVCLMDVPRLDIRPSVND